MTAQTIKKQNPNKEQQMEELKSHGLFTYEQVLDSMEQFMEKHFKRSRRLLNPIGLERRNMRRICQRNPKFQEVKPGFFGLATV